MNRAYTFKDMVRTLAVGWGEQGRAVASYWQEYNKAFFGGRLKPLPIFLTPVTPYGRMVGWTCCGGAVTHIALCAPRVGQVLVADRSTLLHEMIHQSLHESGLYTSHDGEPWRREIMRVHKLLTGEEIWAGAYTVAKVKDADGGRRSVRLNRPHSETGAPSLTQDQIARWPHSLAVKLGPLSACC
jgi:hypothetical protein